MNTPKDHIESAFAVERSVLSKNLDLYMECMNNKPMSKRVTDQEIRDGCILTGVYLTVVANQ